MALEKLTVHAKERLDFVFMFFSKVGKFSTTAQEIFNALGARSGIFELTDIDSYLQGAFRYGFVSKNGEVFTMTLERETVIEMIAEQINNKRIYNANVDSNIKFLENYLG